MFATPKEKKREKKKTKHKQQKEQTLTASLSLEGNNVFSFGIQAYQQLMAKKPSLGDCSASPSWQQAGKQNHLGHYLCTRNGKAKQQKPVLPCNGGKVIMLRPFPLLEYLNIKWLNCLGLSNTAQQKNIDLLPQPTTYSFVKLFEKAKLQFWTEIFAIIFHERAVETLGSNPAISQQLTRGIQMSVLHSFHLQQEENLHNSFHNTPLIFLPAEQQQPTFPSQHRNTSPYEKANLCFSGKQWFFNRNDGLPGQANGKGSRYVPFSTRWNQTPPEHCNATSFAADVTKCLCWLQRLREIKHHSSCHSC